MRYGIRQGIDSTVFAAAGTARKAPGWRGGNEVPTADVLLRRGGYEPTVKQHNMWGSTDYTWNTHAGAAYPQSDTYEGRKKPEQGRLFTETPSKIAAAFADPSMKMAVPTLLGMALNEGRRIGTGVMADSSLSKHSSPIAKRGLKAGVLVPNPQNPRGRMTNDIDFSHKATAIGEHESLEASGLDVKYLMGDDAVEATPQQVSEGRDTIRTLLRSKKSAAPTEKSVLRGMPAADRRMHTWHNANADNPDRTNTAGHDNPLNLGHQHNPVAQANQQAWYTRHYSDPEPPVSWAEEKRLDYEVSSGNRAMYTPGYVKASSDFFVHDDNRLSDADISQRSKRLRDHTTSKTVTRPAPADEPSPSMQEWQSSAPKPGKGQRKLAL